MIGVFYRAALPSSPNRPGAFANSSRVGSLLNRPDVWNTHPVVVFSLGSLVRNTAAVARVSRLYVVYVWGTSSPFSVDHSAYGIGHVAYGIGHVAYAIGRTRSFFIIWPLGRGAAPLRLPRIPIEKTSYGSLCGRGSDTRPASNGRQEDELSQWRNRLSRYREVAGFFMLGEMKGW